jgi:hypothetical protein
LRSKQQLFYEYWKEQHPDHDLPLVMRMMVHYRGFRGTDDFYWWWDKEAQRHKDLPDVVIAYRSIPRGAIFRLEDAEREELIQEVRGRHEQDTLQKYIDQAQPRKLHHLLCEGGDNPRYADVRGRLAELFAQRDIERVMPQRMKSYRNGDIHHFNNTYRDGTEIDQILTFYGEKPYQTLINRLSQYNHLVLAQPNLIAERAA